MPQMEWLESPFEEFLPGPRTLRLSAGCLQASAGGEYGDETGGQAELFTYHSPHLRHQIHHTAGAAFASEAEPILELECKRASFSQVGQLFFEGRFDIVGMKVLTPDDE